MVREAKGPPGRAAAVLATTLFVPVLLASALVLGIPALGWGLGSGRAAEAAAPQIPPARAWLLADAGTGAILASRQPHVPYPPASTIKLMTAIVALEKLPTSSTVTVSALAAGRPAMRIGMKQGEVWPLRDALHALIVTSANDAAYGLAEQASGSLDAFAAAMTAEGARLGMVDSTFADPAGLDDSWSFRGGSLASAYDLAVAARNALSIPAIADAARLLVYRFTGPDGTPHVLRNHNRVFLEGYPGATGMKTGYTDRAGGTVVDTASRNGRTLIAVVLGAPDARGTARALLDTGFAELTIPPGASRLPPVRAYTADTPTRVADASTARPAPAAAPPQRARPLATLPTATRSGAAHSGGISVRTILLVGLALAILVVVLRRRAVVHAQHSRAEHRRDLRRKRRSTR